jgi:hypothetical protein
MRALNRNQPRKTDTTLQSALSTNVAEKYQTAYIALLGGLLTNSRTVGFPTSLEVQNTPLFYVGASWEELGSTVFENRKFRPSVSYSLLFGHFTGAVISDILANVRFQANLGYTVYQNDPVGLYPFLGIGAQRVRVDNTSAAVQLFAQGGLGIDYFLPQSPVLIGLRSGYIYTANPFSGGSTPRISNQHGFLCQVYVGFRIL